MGCGASNSSWLTTQAHTTFQASCPPSPLPRRDSPVAIYCPPPSDFDLLERLDEVDEDEEAHAERDQGGWKRIQKLSALGGITEEPEPVDPSALGGVEHMSFEEACEKLDIVIDLLRSHHNLQYGNSGEVGPGAAEFCPWKFIKYYSHRRPSLPANYAAKWIEKLVDNRLAAVCVSIWPAFEEKYVQDMTTNNLQAFLQPVTTLWNGTSNSVRFCQQFVDSGGIRVLLSSLNHAQFGVHSVNARKEDAMFCATIDGYLSIMYNVLHKLDSPAKLQFRNERGHNAIFDFSQNCQINRLKWKAFFCLVYASTDGELDGVLSGKSNNDDQIPKDHNDVIGPVLVAFNRAMRKETHEGGMEELGMDCNVIEFIDCFNQLAQNDNNKRRLMRAGLTASLLLVVSEPRRDVEIIKAVEGLWQLSFNTANFDVLRTDVEMVAKLRDMSTWRNQKIAEISNAFLWWLTYGGEHDACGLLKLNSMENEIAISYHWKQKQWAMLMKYELERSGFRVWVDLDWGTDAGEMGITYVAEGIQRSSLALAFLSNSYQESCRCRSEFQYIRLLHKPILTVKVETEHAPDGWLAEYFDHLIPPNPAWDISSCRTIQTNLRPLLEKINSTKMDDTASMTNRAITPSDSAVSNKFRHSPGDSPSELESWHETDVQRWLDAAGFLRHKQKFEQIDGRKLVELRETYFTLPVEYFKQVKSMLVKRKVETVLAFTNALLAL